MEKIIGLKEFRNNADAYADKVKTGQSFIVVKRSKPIFKISPITEDNEPEWEEVIDFTKITKGGVKIQDLLARL